MEIAHAELISFALDPFMIILHVLFHAQHLTLRKKVKRRRQWKFNFVNIW